MTLSSEGNTAMRNEGVKFDQGKPTFEYLPFDALGATNEVYAYGAVKYAPRNWEKGMKWLRLWNGVLRHLFAWSIGEDKDPDTGKSHLAHAACGILMLLSSEIRQIGEDDRVKGQ